MSTRASRACFASGSECPCCISCCRCCSVAACCCCCCLCTFLLVLFGHLLHALCTCPGAKTPPPAGCAAAADNVVWQLIARLLNTLPVHAARQQPVCVHHPLAVLLGSLHLWTASGTYRLGDGKGHMCKARGPSSIRKEGGQRCGDHDRSRAMVRQPAGQLARAQPSHTPPPPLHIPCTNHAWLPRLTLLVSGSVGVAPRSG